MSEPTTTAEIAAAIAPVLQPISVPVPVPGADKKPDTATPPAAAETPPKEATADDAAKDDEAPSPKKSAQHRISELYAQKKAAERYAASKENEARELRRQLEEITRTTDPNDYAAQQRAEMKVAVKEERLQQIESEAKAGGDAAFNLRQATFNAKVEAARERLPDIDQALREFASVPVSDAAADIISESDKSAELAYFLAKNPADAREIYALPPHKQAYALAMIEKGLSPGKSRRTSNAPPPVPMVGASSAPSSPAVADMGVDDIAKQIYGRRS